MYMYTCMPVMTHKVKAHSTWTWHQSIISFTHYYMYMYKHGFFAHAGSEGKIQEWEEKEDVCYYWTISSDGDPRQCALHVKWDLSMCFN